MHFTYCSPTQNSDPRQGDILARTPAIERILEAVHPWYHKNATVPLFFAQTLIASLSAEEQDDQQQQLAWVFLIFPS